MYLCVQTFHLHIQQLFIWAKRAAVQTVSLGVAPGKPLPGCGQGWLTLCAWSLPLTPCLHPAWRLLLLGQWLEHFSPQLPILVHTPTQAEQQLTGCHTKDADACEAPGQGQLLPAGDSNAKRVSSWLLSGRLVGSRHPELLHAISIRLHKECGLAHCNYLWSLPVVVGMLGAHERVSHTQQGSKSSAAELRLPQTRAANVC